MTLFRNGEAGIREANVIKEESERIQENGLAELSRPKRGNNGISVLGDKVQ